MAAHQNKVLSRLLEDLDLGYSIAEEDTLLEAARIETSAFTDLVNDRVDLILGTKGSGKSALFRIFVDFMPNYLLTQSRALLRSINQPSGGRRCSTLGELEPIEGELSGLFRLGTLVGPCLKNTPNRAQSFTAQ
jgi:hypothetical protein